MGWLTRLFGNETKKEETMKMAPTTTQKDEKEMIRMAKDPVCGMEVNEKTAAGKSEYMGKTYYFCAPGCKKTFDANPTKYLKGGVQQMPGHGGHHM